MTAFNIYKETALPGTLQPHSIYLIAPAARPDYVEMYTTGASAATVKRIINEVDVQALIDSSLSTSSAIEIVDDIAARDALVLTQNTTVMVLDASADGTVAAGAATYAYRHSNTSFTKISEAESMDVTLTWANITGSPTSAVADIDDAVTKRHTHANKTELDKIGEDVNGNLNYGGNPLVIDWNSTGW